MKYWYGLPRIVVEDLLLEVLELVLGVFLKAYNDLGG